MTDACVDDVGGSAIRKTKATSLACGCMFTVDEASEMVHAAVRRDETAVRHDDVGVRREAHVALRPEPHRGHPLGPVPVGAGEAAQGRDAQDQGTRTS